MTHEHVKSATDKAKGAIDDSSKKQPEPEFDKPLGSSHNDELNALSSKYSNSAASRCGLGVPIARHVG
jgi:hypothetical protein